MEFEDQQKKWQIELNWRAHVSKYVALQTKMRQEGKGISPEQYSIEKGIDQSAFRWWLTLIKMEDKFTFYRSSATEYLNRAKRSLEVLDQYIDVDPKLRMPLIRDAIIAYAALFCKSKGRVFTKWHLESQTFVPSSLLEIHNKICIDRDLIFAHCDLGARDPKVSLIGITLRGQGFYWENYKALIPQFKELIEAVLSRLETYTEEEDMVSAEDAFKEFTEPPPTAKVDPGSPSTNNKPLMAGSKQTQGIVPNKNEGIATPVMKPIYRSFAFLLAISIFIAMLIKWHYFNYGLFVIVPILLSPLEIWLALAMLFISFKGRAPKWFFGKQLNRPI